MRIILLGAPGSGKGTQGKFITEQYNIPQISTGDILREKIFSNHKIGKTIKNIVQTGNLVSDEIVCNLIKNRINKNDCTHGFILDGFPRTIEQAVYLSQNKIKINYVLEFIISYKYILERISGRRIHMQSGRIYHTKFYPPKIKDTDDLTGELLITREDDKKESVKKRLEEHKKIIYPLVQYYLQEQRLGNLKFFQINAEDSLLLIQEKIKNFLQK